MLYKDNIKYNKFYLVGTKNALELIKMLNIIFISFVIKSLHVYIYITIKNIKEKFL